MEIFLAALLAFLIGMFVGAWNYRDREIVRTEVMPALLEMQDGDRLVICSKERLSMEQMNALRETWQNMNGRHKVMVLPGDLRLTVLRGFRAGNGELNPIPQDDPRP